MLLNGSCLICRATAFDLPLGTRVGYGAGDLWLGPPTDGGEEGNPVTHTWNPTFELTYWRLGLQIASEWRRRSGRSPKPQWSDVLDRLAAPTVLATNLSTERRANRSTTPARPQPLNTGPRAYAINANCWGFAVKRVPIAGKHQCSGAYQSHPLFLGALGMINGAAVTPPIDLQVMNTTLALSISGWDWTSTWGWDFPLWAFSQMRLGWSPSAVVDMLLRDETKNLYLANGHNYQSDHLPCYLPGNGGLLAAVAMMAGGFASGDGRPVPVGFPDAWGARSEGFKSFP